MLDGPPERRGLRSGPFHPWCYMAAGRGAPLLNSALGVAKRRRMVTSPKAAYILWEQSEEHD